MTKGGRFVRPFFVMFVMDEAVPAMNQPETRFRYRHSAISGQTILYSG